MEKDKVMEYKFGMKVLFMKANGLEIELMVMED